MPAIRVSCIALASACLLTFASLGAHAAPAEPPVPIADFFDNPTFSAAVLSPDARSLAVLVNSSNGRDRLAVLNLDDRAIKVVAEFKDADVALFQWVNNERLVYNSRDRHSAPGEQRYAAGLFAVNRDGSGARQLVDVNASPVTSTSPTRRMLPSNTALLAQRGAQNSDAVYVTRPRADGEGPATLELLRLDTVTGRTTEVEGPANTISWRLDAKGEPRLATSVLKNEKTIHYLDPADGKWRALATFDSYLGGKGAFTPLAFAPDGTLYVGHDQGGKMALAAFDFATGKVRPEALLKIEDFDFQGGLIATHDQLLGVRYLGDAQATAWFDPKMKAIQAAVDALLPATINLLAVAPRAETPWIVVQSYSDRQPRVLLMFNSDTGKLTKIGDTLPKIDPRRMASQEFVRYKARDGLSIPAWLTMPNNSKGRKVPLVVMVHGGPYVRGNEWGWRASPQFLASRGYAVLEPEFRGSRGFGARHFRAGWKQWGLAMQDDIADGARWAIEQGLVDPQRICIAGASYGGYSTLMGLVRDPDLFKCGINYVGVTDIKLLYTGHWSAASDTTDTFKQYGMPSLVGDLVKDAEQLAATSPLVQAARVTRPLLMAYGGVDKRVPIYHGKKFLDAVRQTNKDVEWVVYEDEGHGWSLPSTRVDFWGRVEKFLNRNIGTP